MDIDTLHSQLFNSRYNVYSVIDGASAPVLLGRLAEYEPKHTCLFRGELSIEMAEVAPYMVQLEAGDDFTNWLLEYAIEYPCCIFAHTDKDFLTLRKHFRGFLRVESPEGETLHFRYYDPRVLGIYLPNCEEEENEVIYADVINKFLIADAEEQLVKEFIRS